MKKAILCFNNIKLKHSEIHKLRGYIGNIFAQHDLIHNHDAKTGKSIYRYPLIQFKIIDKVPCIIAFTEKAVQIFNEIFMTLNEIVIEDKRIPIFEKDFKLENSNFGFSDETFMYKFLSPWIGLNQKNFGIYINLKFQKEKNDLLERILTGNILSMSKYLGLHLDQNQRINIDLKLQQTKVILKGKNMIGFKGIFKTNFMIPNYMGLGKSVSRGFGNIKKIL